MAEYIARRDPKMRYVFTLVMVLAIAALGNVMMTIASSAAQKGASFLWLPAALQYCAGVWLGPWLGAIAGGLGAYLAGIWAYGGFGLVDIIMNPIAGGFANAMLPWFLFKIFRIDPTFGAEKPEEVLEATIKLLGLVVVVVLAGLLNVIFALPMPWGYLLPLAALVVGARLLLSGYTFNQRHLMLAMGIAIFISAVSAFIGAIGSTVGGNPFRAALIDPGLPWFAGDTVSAMLSPFLLALYTTRLRVAGVAE